MKRGMALGLLLMAVGAILFDGCVRLRSYPGALASLFVMGSGLCLLQTAANPYVSILGPIDAAARRISLMGICNKAAGILSPLVMGGTLLSGADAIERALDRTTDPQLRAGLLDQLAAKVHAPYMVMAAVLGLLAVWVLRSGLPEISAAQANRQIQDGREGSIFRFSHLWLGALCMFLYVGAEVMAGDAIGTYGKGFGLPIGETRYFTALTMGGMLLGYLLGLAAIPRLLSQAQGLAVSAMLGLVFAAGAWLTAGHVSVGFVAALGLANAMMWPTIVSRAGHRRLGRAHRARLGPADHGRGRRRGDPAHLRPAQGAVAVPDGVLRGGDALLPVRAVLRAVGVQGGRSSNDRRARVAELGKGLVGCQGLEP